jgi:hypothetical protein
MVLGGWNISQTKTANSGLPFPARQIQFALKLIF